MRKELIAYTSTFLTLNFRIANPFLSGFALIQ